MRAFEVNCRVAAGTDSEPEECVGRTIAVLHTLHTIIHLTNVHIFHRQQHLDSLSHSKAETWVSTVITICLLFEYTYGEYSSMEFICLATSPQSIYRGIEWMDAKWKPRRLHCRHYILSAHQPTNLTLFCGPSGNALLLKLIRAKFPTTGRTKFTALDGDWLGGGHSWSIFGVEITSVH